ncbi:hypothetical protein CLD22_09910 [Rubrivivax gelatinosus]|nr:hypothetical protein [Rubrivivax gelatinosus]
MSATPQTADDPEIHIAGVLVQARPAAVAALRTQIGSLAGAELVGAGDDGRIAVVVEGVGAASVLQVLDALRELPGVLNVALVYQHAEARSALQEGVPP